MKERDCGSKKGNNNNNNKKLTAINSQFMHAKHTRV